MPRKSKKLHSYIEKLINYTCKKYNLDKDKMLKELPAYYYWDIETLRKMTFPY